MPDENLRQYRVWCDTENAWVYSDYILQSQGPPTTCPHNTNHTIDPSRTAVVSTVPPDGTYDADGNLLTVPEPRPGSETYFYVPNLCDPCAWYQKATQLIEQAMSTADDQTFTSGVSNWIDLTHGRVFREDEVPNHAAYIPLIEVDTGGGFMPMTENTWGASDNDYSIDYPNGSVTFNTPLQPTDQVRATFYHAGSSEFTIEPELGKRLKVLYVEVQFTKDVEMSGDILFDIYAANPADPTVQAMGTCTVAAAPLTAAELDIAGVKLTGVAGARTPGSDDFDMSLGTTDAIAAEIAAALMDPANSFITQGILGAAIPAGSSITLVAGAAFPGPFGNTVSLAVTVTPGGGLVLSGAAMAGGAWNQIIVKQERYKRLIDFFQESTGPFPVIPAFGGGGDRGIPSDVITIPFNYLAYRDMKSTQGVKMVCRVEGNTPLPGYFANATFYCLSENET
jgi:hypothetical protein